MNMIAKAGIVGRIATVTNFVYKTFFGDPKDANEAYLRVYPTIRLAVREFGRDSKEVQGLLDMLGDLSAVGVKRRNFIRRYVSPLDGWLLLPHDPNNIPYGFWH